MVWRSVRFVLHFAASLISRYDALGLLRAFYGAVSLARMCFR